MNELYVKLRRNLGLSLILLIGLGVEFSNFQSMFVKFMLQYRPDWGAFNHIPAIFLSAFLLLCIVIFGIRRQVALSWFLALLTCVISFAVYSRMNLSWNWDEMNEIHFVILILSGMLPLLVAYSTHQITHDNEATFDEMEEYERRHRKPARQSGGNYSNPPRYQVQEQYPHNYAQRHAPQAKTQPPRDVPRGKYGIGEVDEFRREPVQRTIYRQPENYVPPMYEPSYEPTPQPEYRPPVPPQPDADEHSHTKYAQLKPTPRVVRPQVQVEPEEKQPAVQFAERREVLLKVDKPREGATDRKPATNKPASGYLITCQHCGAQSMKKSKAAKYCSEECRNEANKNKAGNASSATTGVAFEMKRDEYDTKGIMEWVNVG
ncbi:hypothetical protein [Rhodoflexus caldus]|uniref:hypothetical protein n=1 Tax=Rhodoflexus caldus TaxID=2891236 RepID=UPI00202A5508|nr:hypothetical protein [Rhodoflexus caldus]